MNNIASLDSSDLPSPGTMKAISGDAGGILIANVDGQIYAIAQKCPHMGADLCQGKLSGSIVTCPKHGAAFDVKNGHAVAPASILFLKMKANNVTTYSVKQESEKVFIGA
jgi:3-phenylpropionate/trans-cinnamate dioxygenase ferredoxin component